MAKDIKALLEVLCNQQSLDTLYFLIEDTHLDQESDKILIDIVKNKNIQNLFIGISRINVCDSAVIEILKILKEIKRNKVFLGIARNQT